MELAPTFQPRICSNNAGLAAAEPEIPVKWSSTKPVIVVTDNYPTELPRNVKINKILRDWSDESVKNDHFTRIRARARPGLKYLNIFWAEKLLLVITQQILPRNVEKNLFSLHFWIDQLTLS
jgi:hypothetical protein